jgi:rubrerythrin
VKHIPDNYLVEWYIGVAKRRGWDEVVRLLKQYPKNEERMKTLIKKRLGHERD